MNEISIEIAKLTALMTQAAAIAAPFDVQIKQLEVQKADALATLQWEIDNLKMLLREHVLSTKRSVKTEGLSISYVQKQTWDDGLLRAMADEMPSIMQCCKDGSYLTFRYRG